ncbi:signal peptidase 22 kDa subunit [Sistotremastrum niveocremeum HHB9708]|uniref:Signal peptidase subunit 3 n=1 Tax=Sistotremastrum niveocremeum HHB9708 TaxID=1314777 RepID=A0A164Z350_9AGAM|nr:signal peptidase 22 kDa subunit [Sistotremastrum niveocremeum HHB9708]
MNDKLDLTSLFHWNTKQVFLYLTAEYTNAQGTQNEAVFWDRIVRRKEDANIHIAGGNKYFLKDLTRSFKNATSVTYSMKYNVMPWIGPLTWGEAGRTEALPLPPAQNTV